MFKKNKIVGGGGVGRYTTQNELTTLESQATIEENSQQNANRQAVETYCIDSGSVMSECKSVNHTQRISYTNEVGSDFLQNKDTQVTRDYNAGVQRRENKDGKRMRIAYNRQSDKGSRQSTAIKAHTYRTATLQIVMWLLAFVTMFILALQPILQSRSNMSMAGGPTNGTGYDNAPATVISNGKALFTSSGVNADVLMELLNAVNSSSVWGSKTAPTSGSSVTYLSAKDFGQYGDQSSWADTAKGNAQIVLKLLDDTTTTTNNVDDAAAQYWQVVYRSTSANEDVLTLYMVDQYTTAQFNPSSTTNGYYREGNYSHSYLRDNTVLPTYQTMTDTYSQLDQYVVTPSGVPGLWQSNAYQTSRNNSRASYSTGNGTSGFADGSSYYGLANGMDGGSGGHSSWSSTVQNIYTDKLWVPSGFEVLHTGYGSSETSTIQDTGRTFDEGEDISYTNSYNSASTTLYSSSSGTEDYRTGLWELNGYDRAFGDTTNGSWEWLRSGHSNDTHYARAVSWRGDNGGGYVYNSYGVRVALHLNLKSLASNLLGTDSVPHDTYYSVNLQADTQIEADTNALLIVSSANGQAMMYRVSATSTQINITMPKLVVGRTYTITVINGEISGTLSATGDATVKQTPYTFVCDTEDAEITLSGLTIS